MIKCSEDCQPICDFCLYFRNGILIRGADIEDGWCKRHRRKQALCGACSDFYCYTASPWFLRVYYWIFVIWPYRFNYWRVNKKKYLTILFFC